MTKKFFLYHFFVSKKKSLSIVLSSDYMLCNNHTTSFVPLRSPIAIHSFIANMSRGLNLIEIGTRQGDTVRCYRNFASNVVAIENNAAYCKYLRSIQNITALCPKNAFYNKKWNADAITFWLDEQWDEKMITFLLSQKRLGIVKNHTRLWVLADNQLKEDAMKKDRILKTWASHVKQVLDVSFDERELCKNGMRLMKKRPNYYLNCRRASGTFSILELA